MKRMPPPPRLTRLLARTLHLVAGSTLAVMAYAPLAWMEWLRPPAQWLVVPTLVASGLWLWLGARLARAFAPHRAPGNGGRA